MARSGCSVPNDETRSRARKVVRGLKRAYPDAECALQHHGPFQLLAATILSAQCTDQRVNNLTAFWSHYFWYRSSILCKSKQQPNCCET